MATIHGTNKQTKESISRFLGVYETDDGDTALKPGVASKMVNWRITEGYHLQTRPGYISERVTGVGEIMAMHTAYCGDVPYSLLVTNDGIWLKNKGENTWTVYKNKDWGVVWSFARATLFEFASKIYVIDGYHMARITPYLDGNGKVMLTIAEVTDGYVPLVVTGANPAGGGTTLERINLLTSKRRVQYSADGTSTAFVLPEAAVSVDKVIVDNVDVTAGWTLSQDGKTATAQTAPPQGVNNVEITYDTGAQTTENQANRALILNQRFAEAYNGSTDTRIFLAGDGTNICYYSGVTEAGEPSAEYFPALNEIRVDASNSPITGMARHYTRLLVFKPDSTWSVGYETTYLADGTETVGFRLVPMHREIGSDAPGQVATVKNFARTYCRGNLYDWRQTASYYQDERYAKLISEPVRRSMRKADKDKLYLFDDDERQRFYAFLNDEDGTVIVNDYSLDVWYVWTGFYNVHHMVRDGTGGLLFSSWEGSETDSRICYLYDTLSYDYVFHPATEDLEFDPATDDPQKHAYWTRSIIKAEWESGHMSFGSESTRKYSSYVWTTLLAGPGAIASITARTDRRAEYSIKTDYANTTGLFDAVEFDRFSFETYLAPFAKRLKLKVKKFVYYKLIITNEDPQAEHDEFYPRVWAAWDRPPRSDGNTGTVCVLNVDIKLRATSDAK